MLVDKMVSFEHVIVAMTVEWIEKYGTPEKTYVTRGTYTDSLNPIYLMLRWFIQTKVWEHTPVTPTDA